MINKRKRNILITIIVLLSIASDQISKVWVRNNFESYIEKSIIGDVFTLIKVENTGAFLGMGSELSETLRVLLLIVLPVIVLVSITIYTYIDKSLDKTSIIGFSLIIGGGIGNIFDRIVYGSVTDFQISLFRWKTVRPPLAFRQMRRVLLEQAVIRMRFNVLIRSLFW